MLDQAGTRMVPFAAALDAPTVVFAMHGMGSNDSDVPTMALLPELMHRHAFGRPLALRDASSATEAAARRLGCSASRFPTGSAAAACWGQGRSLPRRFV